MTPQMATPALDARIDYWFLRGLRSHRLQQRQDAIRAFEQVLSLDPMHLDAMQWRAIIAFEAQDLPLASIWFRRVLALDPDYVPGHYNLGLCLDELGDHAGALACYERALQLQPDHTQALNNRAILLVAKGHIDEAITVYNQALGLRPDYQDALFNRGVAWAELRQWSKAEHDYQQVIHSEPSHTGAQFALAVAWLTQGKWPVGWEQYEWRWRYPAVAVTRLSNEAPLWDGSGELNGCQILVDGEQGFGDTLQCVRFIFPLIERGARIILRVRSSLLPLLQQLPVERVVESGERVTGCHWQVSLMSLPGLLKTTTTTVPKAAGYLTPPELSLQHWQQCLGKRRRPRIGLVWAGNPAHNNDARRSLSLATLLPSLPGGFEYISLQKRLGMDEAALLSARQDIRPCGTQLQDFADTAGLCGTLDLVISVDTAVAHLAGAMSLPVWILLPYAADWRWLEQGVHTPWYQSARLFRQTRRDEWEPVLNEVREALLALSVPRGAKNR